MSGSIDGPEDYRLAMDASLAFRSAGPQASIGGRDGLARARITATYLWRHHRWPRIEAPRRFTEWVQWRKLHDRDPGLPPLLDKLASKRQARDRLGSDWIMETLWQGRILPAARRIAGPAIVKARHGCRQFSILPHTTTAKEWAHLRRQTLSWEREPYGAWLDEWAYRDVPRGLLAETLIGDGRVLPVDYKIYVFGGQATHVQVHLDRAGQHRWILHDRTWRPLIAGSEAPPRPRSLPAMLAAAETLSDGRDFVRVDFYEVAGQPVFGEFCLYPGSGLDPFAADWIDEELGALWSAARARQTPLVSATNTSSRSASRVVTSSIA